MALNFLMEAGGGEPSPPLPPPFRADALVLGEGDRSALTSSPSACCPGGSRFFLRGRYFVRVWPMAWPGCWAEWGDWDALPAPAAAPHSARPFHRHPACIGLSS